jgi:hypothetical protein
MPLNRSKSPKERLRFSADRTDMMTSIRYTKKPATGEPAAGWKNKPRRRARRGP